MTEIQEITTHLAVNKDVIKGAITVADATVDRTIIISTLTIFDTSIFITKGPSLGLVIYLLETPFPQMLLLCWTLDIGPTHGFYPGTSHAQGQ